MRKANVGNSRGFTLVELLVVIGIIAALAAVVIPNVSRFVGQGDTAANDTERQTVQAAMDLLMADEGLTSVTAQSSPINDMASSTPALYGYVGSSGTVDYIRTQVTKCNYTWDTEGRVTQDSCP